jgi:hypothetical protein
VIEAGCKRTRYQKAARRLKQLMRLVRNDASMTLRVQRKLTSAQREVLDAKAQLKDGERLGPLGAKMGRLLVRRVRLALHSADVVANGGKLKYGHKHGRRRKRVRGQRRRSFDTAAAPHPIKSAVPSEHSAPKVMRCRS